MSKIIVALVGGGGSGKSSVARHLHDTRGFAVFSISAPIREYALEHGMPLKSRTDFAAAHAAIVREHGPGYLLGKLLETPGSLLCVDGLRSPAYERLLRDAGTVTIGFECLAPVRFARTRASGDAAKYPPTLEAFIQNEEDEEQVVIGPGIRLETQALLDHADFTVDATRPQGEVFAAVDAIVDRLVAAQQIA